ncbi:response regulator [Glycomyces sp. NPDC048151]|uniref:response regulator n=1 Tax=Glycomyces sp. NPDC048151 TaxID=3364002 RepID=UPI00371B7AD4
MSEAIWIELIKVLPAFLWIGFGFIALAIAKRIFTAQAPRMTKVETPWVTVELAQQAIEQAAMRGPEPQIPLLAEPDWTRYPLPTQQVPTGAVYGTVPPPSPPAEPADEDDAVHTEPPAEPKPDLLATPPADTPADPEPRDDRPPATMTAPNQQVPGIPPTYPVIAAPPGGGTYYGQGAQWNQPLPAAYRQPLAYRPGHAENRSKRAATKLALAAGDLQGGAILWADDHPEWNDSLVRLFRTAGITVDPVASTDEAMRALGKRSYDLVITDMRREGEPDGDAAGMRLVDRMVTAGIPTPAVFFSENSAAHAAPHPRAITTTSSPEKLVDIVVEFVGDLRAQQSSSNASSSWIDRLTGKQT